MALDIAFWEQLSTTVKVLTPILDCIHHIEADK